MPDHTVETPSSQTTVASSGTPPLQSPGVSQAIALCAAGLVASYFLSWINFLGFKASGFDLVQKYGGASLLLWAIPLFGVVALVASITKSSLRTAAQLAGVIPIFALGYGLYDSGTDLLKLLDFGAYLGIGTGVVMIVLATRLK